jgi:multiple sugar transport system substrate-binding protein
VEAYKKRIYPGNLDAMTYEGKLYGLPYYTDFHVWTYRADILEQAGFKDGGRTLQDVHERAMAIKKKGIMKYPIAFPFKFHPWGNWPWWAVNYASGLNFFDEKGDPLMHKDERFATILQWFVDGMYKHEYIDPKVIELDENNVRDATAAGNYAYGSHTKYDVQRVNDPKFSKVPGKIKMMPHPSLEPDVYGTVSWTRMYSLTDQIKDDRIEPAWTLIQYLGGKDKDGKLYTAKRWYLLKALGFAYPELWEDKDIVESTSKWADLEVIKQIGKTARAIEIIKTPWYYDFERNFILTVQQAVTRKKSVNDTLQDLADLAKKVKKEWD